MNPACACIQVTCTYVEANKMRLAQKSSTELSNILLFGFKIQNLPSRGDQ